MTKEEIRRHVDRFLSMRYFKEADASDEDKRHFETIVAECAEYVLGQDEIARHAEERSPWISVDDRLPEVGRDGSSRYVLVRYKNCIPTAAKYADGRYSVRYTRKEDNRKKECRWFTADFCPSRQAVTHWMPIPEILTKDR